MTRTVCGQMERRQAITKSIIPAFTSKYRVVSRNLTKYGSFPIGNSNRSPQNNKQE